jgi:hypothetical protein
MRETPHDLASRGVPVFTMLVLIVVVTTITTAHPSP